MKLDGLGWIVMGCGEELIANIRFDIELFSQLPSQRGFQRFSQFDFATWKFPQVREMHVRRTLRQQDVLVSMNDCCNDNDHNISFRTVATRRSIPVWCRSLPAF
jgi:hypothetical protein